MADTKVTHTLFLGPRILKPRASDMVRQLSVHRIPSHHRVQLSPFWEVCTTHIDSRRWLRHEPDTARSA